MKPAQVRKFFRMPNNQGTCNTTSNVNETLQEDNFIPVYNVYLSELNIALEEDAICYLDNKNEE